RDGLRAGGHPAVEQRDHPARTRGVHRLRRAGTTAPPAASVAQCARLRERRRRATRGNSRASRVMEATLGRRASAEAVWAAMLVAAVVGSGIAAQRLSPGNTGLQLLENSTATGAVLIALILALGPISGAHFNPVVTLADRVLGGTNTRDASVYV